MVIVVMVILGMLGPPAVFISMAKDAKRANRKERSKNLYIAAIVYLIVGLGSCGTLIYSL